MYCSVLNNDNHCINDFYTVIIVFVSNDILTVVLSKRLYFVSLSFKTINLPVLLFHSCTLLYKSI